MDLNIALDRVRDIVYRARSLGTRVLDNGTELVGHLPHVAPEAWLHVLYPKLPADLVESLEPACKRPLPEGYREFLGHMNGIWLFSNALTLYGLRRSYERTGDAVWQPFNVIDANTLKRPAGAEPSDFIIGGYKSDGSKLYVDRDTGEARRRLRAQPGVLNRWPSLMEMLASEAERLAGHFDELGRRIDPRVPTTPPTDA